MDPITLALQNRKPKPKPIIPYVSQGYGITRPVPGAAPPPVTQDAYVPPAPPPTQPAMTDAEKSAYYTNLAHGTAPYVSGAAGLRAEEETAAGGAAEQIRQRLIAFGIIPPEFQDKYGWVNPETRTLAQQATTAGTSITARLQQAHANLLRQNSKSLAARGALRSGATGSALERAMLNQRQQYSTALGELLGGVGGVYGNYQEGFDRRAAAWRKLEEDAYGAVKDTALPGPGQAPPTGEPPPAPAWAPNPEVAPEGWLAPPIAYNPIRGGPWMAV